MFRARLKSFYGCEAGATSIEYALIAAFISFALITGASALGVEVSAIFSDSAKGMQKRPAVT